MLQPPEIKKETPKTAQPAAMDYDINLNNIDDLLGELSQPVQDFKPKTEKAGQEEDVYDPVFGGKTIEHITISPEQNKRNGERTARFFDSILSTAAQTIAKAETREPYKATDGDLQDIAEAWAEYTKDKDFNIPPWATLAILYLTVYMPKITKAFNDRRINELSDRVTKLEKEAENGTV
jgi:hypothetical protein